MNAQANELSLWQSPPFILRTIRKQVMLLCALAFSQLILVVADVDAFGGGGIGVQMCLYDGPVCVQGIQSSCRDLDIYSSDEDRALLGVHCPCSGKGCSQGTNCYALKCGSICSGTQMGGCSEVLRMPTWQTDGFKFCVRRQHRPSMLITCKNIPDNDSFILCSVFGSILCICCGLAVAVRRADAADAAECEYEGFREPQVE